MSVVVLLLSMKYIVVNPAFIKESLLFYVEKDYGKDDYYVIKRKNPYVHIYMLLNLRSWFHNVLCRSWYRLTAISSPTMTADLHGISDSYDRIHHSKAYGHKDK